MLVAAITVAFGGVIIVEELRVRGEAEPAALKAKIAALQNEGATLAAELNESRALIGGVVPNGEYASVRIHLVGAEQDPPMLVFDDELMFTGEDALAAAIEDGKDPVELFGEEYAINASYLLYFRNTDPTWHTVPIAPDAQVLLNSWKFKQHGGFEVVTVPLETFGRVYNSDGHANVHFRFGHYVLRLEGGEVVKIEELNLSP